MPANGETQTGDLQVQAPGYKDDNKIRQVVPDVIELAAKLRAGLGNDEVAARASAFALASNADRTYGIQITGVEPELEPRVSSLPGLIKEGRFLGDMAAGVAGGAGRRAQEALPGDLGCGRARWFGCWMAASSARIIGKPRSSRIARASRKRCYEAVRFLDRMCFGLEVGPPQSPVVQRGSQAGCHLPAILPKLLAEFAHFQTVDAAERVGRL